MNTSGISKLGLIGRGIHYSLSPLIHSTAANYLGISAEYRLHELNSAEAVEKFISEAWQSGATGFNLTQPWKRAFNGKPVNTLFREKGSAYWSATSTDGAGFIKAIAKAGCTPEKISRIVFLGAGAVVETLVEAIGAEGAAKPEIHCIARDRKAPAGTGKSWQFHSWDPASLGRLLAGDCNGTLIIQATPLPLQGDNLHAFAKELAKLPAAAKCWVSDLCYGKVSELLQTAQNMGIAAQDGLPMLIEQARSAQEIWWGQSAPYDVIEEACLKVSGQR